MRTRRFIIIPAIVAFSFAGSALASTAMAGTTAPAAAVKTHSVTVNPFTFYHA